MRRAIQCIGLLAAGAIMLSFGSAVAAKSKFSRSPAAKRSAWGKPGAASLNRHAAYAAPAKSQVIAVKPNNQDLRGWYDQLGGGGQDQGQAAQVVQRPTDPKSCPNPPASRPDQRRVQQVVQGPGQVVPPVSEPGCPVSKPGRPVSKPDRPVSKPGRPVSNPAQQR